jgi:hypothetical protein
MVSAAVFPASRAASVTRNLRVLSTEKMFVRPDRLVQKRGHELGKHLPVLQPVAVL